MEQRNQRHSNCAQRSLSSWSFMGLLATQFLGAMNDNMFRWFVVPIGIPILGSAEALSLGLVCFTVPYLLFATMAGPMALPRVDPFRRTTRNSRGCPSSTASGRASGSRRREHAQRTTDEQRHQSQGTGSISIYEGERFVKRLPASPKGAILCEPRVERREGNEPRAALGEEDD